MILKDFLECVDYKITEGNEYCWPVFGANAYSLSYWNQDHEGHSMNVTFDRLNQTVYMVEACDYTNQRAYRYINPLFKDAYVQEVKDRGGDDMAWDNVNWVDLELFEDWKEKTLAIKMGLEYDTRVKVPVELSDDDLFELMKQAHERDLTLNQLVEKILVEVLNKEINVINTETDKNAVKNKKGKKKKK